MLSVKKLLYKVLDKLSGVEGFVLTASPSGFAGRGAYDKTTNTVRITIRGASTSNVSSSTSLGNVPSEYRPSANVYGDALCITSSANVGANLLVEPNGNVTQTATNTMRAIFGYIEYTLQNVGGVLRNLSIFKAFSDCKPSERMVASC